MRERPAYASLVDYSKGITVITTAIDIHTHLLELQAERALATIEGIAGNSVYMADLEGEIEATARAYVAAAVTEIATLRAELSGPRVG